MQYASSLLSACAEVTIAGKANTQELAIELINKMNPNLLLLDVELHGGNGFEVLRRTADKNYNVVFTTALFDTALNIITLSGIPVLQKPLDFDELKNILHNFADPQYVQNQKTCLHNLRHTLHNDNVPATIALQCSGTMQHVHLKTIQKAETIEGKLIFFLEDGKPIMCEKDLKYYELLLAGFGFFRVNVNALLNLQQIKTNEAIDDTIALKDGSTLLVSPKKKEAFIEAVKKYNN